MDFKSESVKVKINNEDYEISYPTVEFIQQNIKEQEGMTEEELAKIDGIEQSILKLEKLGLPSSVSRKLRPAQFRAICDAVFEVDLEKKN